MAGYQRPDGQSDKFTLLNANGYKVDLVSSTPTANRIITIPNRDGMMATADQIDYRLLEKITISSTISTTAAIYTMANSPRDVSSVEIIVNGETINSSTSPAPFTVSGNVITWVPSAAYILETTDQVYVRYAISNNAFAFPRTMQFNHLGKVPFYSPAFLNGWSSLSSGTVGTPGTYEQLQYRCSPWGQVEIKGTVKNTSADADSIICLLPPSCTLWEIQISQGFAYNGTQNFSSATFLNSWNLGANPNALKYVAPSGVTVSGGVANVQYHTIRLGFGADKETAVGFGDSIMQGLNASPQATANFFYLWCQAMNFKCDNQGISGTVLCNDAGLANNGRDTYQTRVLARIPSYLVSEYGLNDLRYGTTVSAFINDYREILLATIAAGLASQRIILLSPPYIPPSSYSLYSPYNNGSTSLHAAYATAIYNLAKELGTLFCDMYNLMLNMAWSYTDSDNIHPTTTGHAQMATLLQNNIYAPY